MTRTKGIIAITSVVAATLILSIVFLLSASEDLEALPIMLTNISRSEAVRQYEVGDYFHDLVLQSVLYQTCATTNQRHPDYITLRGSMTVSGTLVNTGEVWSYLLIIDEAYRNFLPMFDVGRPQPYIVQVMDLATAQTFSPSAFDRTDMTGYRVAFRINDMFISTDPYAPDVISGRFARVVAPVLTQTYVYEAHLQISNLFSIAGDGRTMYPDYYAGRYLGDDGKLVLLLTEAGQRYALQGSFASFIGRDYIRTRTVEFSYNEMLDVERYILHTAVLEPHTIIGDNVTIVCPLTWEHVKLFSESTTSTSVLFLLGLPAFLGNSAYASDV